MDEVVVVEVEEEEGVDAAVDMVVTEVATKEVADIGVVLVTVVDMGLEVASKVEWGMGQEEVAMEMTMLLLSTIMETMEAHPPMVDMISQLTSNLLADKEQHEVAVEEDIVHIDWYVF